MSVPNALKISHILFYSGGINTPQTNTLRNNLALLNQPSQPQQNLAHLPATGVLIVLSSWGGNSFEARSIYGLIRSLSYPVEVHAAGIVQSAAVPLILAADRRTCTPNTTFMFHPWSWATEASPGRYLDELQQFPMRLDDEVNWAKSVIIERTQLKTPDIEKLFKTATIVDANFALEHGLIHEISERKIPTGIPTWNVVG